MKGLKKTEEKAIRLIGYTTRESKFLWNRKTNKFDRINPKYVKKNREALKKAMRENGVDTPSSLITTLKRNVRIEGQNGLKKFMESSAYIEMQKLPNFVRIDFIPQNFAGLRISTSYRSNYSKKQGKVPVHILKVIQESSYLVADFGRLRKTYEGENRFNCIGIRTEDNGKFGRKKVVWHYADYYVAVNSDISKAYYKLSNGETGTFSITKSGSFKFKNKTYKMPRQISPAKIKPHHIRRAAENATRGNISFAWDQQQKSPMFVDNLTGEEYHFSNNSTETLCSSRFYEKTFKTALDAFRKRRKQKARAEHSEAVKKFMLAKKEQIFVIICDSIRAGNCKFGTNNFVVRDLGIDPEKIGAVTIGRILEAREDSFTLRACAEAAERYIRKNQIQLT